MTNANTIHVSVFCPKPLQDIANQLSVVIGYNAADIATFAKNEATVNGIECFAAYFPARETFVYVPVSDLSAKAVEAGVDPVAVEDAKLRLRVCDLRQGDPASVLTADTIAVVVQDRFAEGGGLNREASQLARELVGAT